MTVRRSVAVATILAMCLVAASDADQHTKAVDTSLKGLLERLESDDAKIRKEAAKALEARSVDADAGMGGLTGLSDDDDVATMDKFRKEAKPLVSVLATLLLSPYEESRVVAARVLGSIGPDAEACRPALRKIIRDGSNSRGFQMVAVPALLRVTPAREVAGREFLEDCISACGDDSGDLEAPDDVESRRRDDEAFASWCGSFLAAVLVVAGRTTIEVPSLAEVTPSAFPRRLRLTAIVALATLEVEARNAVPTLRRLLNDNDSLVRQFAGLAIVHIEGDPAEIPALIKAMSLDKEESTKFLDEASDFIKQKVQASKMIRKNGGENVLLAVSMLNHRNSFHQRQAIRMLGEIGPPANAAIPELKKLLKSEDKDTRAAAAEALAKIDTTAIPKPNASSKSKAD